MANDQTPSVPGGAGSPDETSLAVSSRFGEAQQRVAAAALLPANTVKVDPGGQTFSTIGAALDSITDAGPQNIYLVTLGPGIYEEQVLLKPYVNLQGAGAAQTSIVYPPATGENFYNRGTIVGASNSSVSDLTASCLGGSWGDWSTALVVAACSPFSVNGVALICDDQGNAGINIETVAVNWNAGPEGPVQLYLYYSEAVARMESDQSVGQALIANGQTTNVQATSSKFSARGGMQSYGVASNGGATVTLDVSYAAGATYALAIPDYHSTLIANNCTIDGPVQQGVQVNNYSPSVGGE